MNMHTTIPPAEAPLALRRALWEAATATEAMIVRNPIRLIEMAELLSRFERDDMERAVDLLMAMFDAMDGDPEAQQANGDELDDDGDGHALSFANHCGLGQHEDDEHDDDDGCAAGDDNLTDWGARAYQMRYGSRYADIDQRPGDIEDAEPAGYIEWQTRGRHKVGRHGAEPLARDRHGNAVAEDAEEDDAAEDNGDREATNEDGDALDHGELDEALAGVRPIYGVDQSKGPINEAEAVRAHYAGAWA